MLKRITEVMSEKQTDGWPNHFHLFPTPKEVGRFLLGLIIDTHDELPEGGAEHMLSEDVQLRLFDANLSGFGYDTEA